MNTYSLYIHTFPNGKRYVGITSSKDPNVRWCNGRGYHLQPLMKNAIQKYGWENVSHEIRLTGLTRDEACKREQFYISLFRSDEYSFGYNMTKGGEGRDRGRNYGSKQCRKENYERHKDWFQQHYKEHREEILERQRQHYKEHREEILERQRNQYRKKKAIKPSE